MREAEQDSLPNLKKTIVRLRAWLSVTSTQLVSANGGTKLGADFGCCSSLSIEQVSILVHCSNIKPKGTEAGWPDGPMASTTSTAPGRIFHVEIFIATTNLHGETDL
jgi:hypothetical protein